MEYIRFLFTSISDDGQYKDFEIYPIENNRICFRIQDYNGNAVNHFFDVDTAVKLSKQLRKTIAFHKEGGENG